MTATKTLAFQIPEELDLRIKKYLASEKERTGKKVSQRLLADCRNGRIDKVLVKSISRFARNTTECLEAVRELKSLGISIFFEEHSIDGCMRASF